MAHLNVTPRPWLQGPTANKLPCVGPGLSDSTPCRGPRPACPLTRRPSASILSSNPIWPFEWAQAAPCGGWAPGSPGLGSTWAGAGGHRRWGAQRPGGGAGDRPGFRGFLCFTVDRLWAFISLPAISTNLFVFISDYNKNEDKGLNFKRSREFRNQVKEGLCF